MDRILLTGLIILVVIAESLAQNSIKDASMRGSLKPLIFALFFYGWVSLFLKKIYRITSMGTTFLLWSVLSTFSVYLIGYYKYNEIITLYDAAGFILCSIGLYLVFYGKEHRSS
jgi:multidrug transporter EmrE-like cation transporter